MRLIDADAFADFIAETSKRQGYDKVKLGSTLTIADVLDAVIAELKGEGLNGFNNAPTIEPERKGKWKETELRSKDGGIKMRWYFLPTIQLIDDTLTIGFLCLWLSFHFKGVEE